MDLGLLLMSFLVGIMVGLTSMGGAALMTPILILVVGVRPTLAVGTDLAYSSITKIAGAWMHWKQGTVDMKVVLRMATTSVPSGLLGVLAVEYLRKHGANVDDAIKHSMGIALLFVAIFMLARTLNLTPGEGLTRFVQAHEIPLTYFWGALVGFGVGLTSVGSGSLIAPLLMIIFMNEPSKAVGTDVMHAVLLVTATGLLHWHTGNVNWDLVPNLLAGSVPGVLVGSWLAPRLPAKALRLGLGTVLAITGWKLI